MQNKIIRLRGVTIIAIVNAFAAILTVAFWGLVFVRVFAADVQPAGLDVSALSTTFGFMIGDLVWSGLVLIVSVPGLWRMRLWGWLSAQMVNMLWLYSMTVVWCRDLHGGTISPGAILFLPFVPFSIWAFLYLWNIRERFWLRNDTSEF